MPLVDSLRHTPYRDPNQLELTGSDDQAGTAIDLAVRVGELLLRCGAGARDVESGVIAVAAASGLDNLEVDITNQSLLVQGRTPAGTLMTMLRVVRSSSRDFARLVAVHRLVEDLAAGRVDLDEATARLRRIRRQKRPWPRWFVSLAYGGLAASVAMLLGAGATAILLGLVSSVLVDRVGIGLGRVGLPAFYVSAVGGAIATMFAWLVFVLGRWGSLGVSAEDFAYVVAGGIVVLLPGRAMASSVEDAITGFPVTGAGRLFGVLLTAAGIIVGVAAGLSMALRAGRALDLGLTAPDALSFAGSGASTAVRVVAGALGGAASSITMRSRRRLVLPSAVLGGLGLLCVDLLHGAAGLGSLSRPRHRVRRHRLRRPPAGAAPGGARPGAHRPGRGATAARPEDLPRDVRAGLRHGHRPGRAERHGRDHGRCDDPARCLGGGSGHRHRRRPGGEHGRAPGPRDHPPAPRPAPLTPAGTCGRRVVLYRSVTYRSTVVQRVAPGGSIPTALCGQLHIANTHLRARSAKPRSAGTFRNHRAETRVGNPRMTTLRRGLGVKPVRRPGT